MKKHLFAGLIVLIIASFFRFYNLNILPPGLYPDEAMNGSNALEALQTTPGAGGFKVFYPENNGREGLFINIQAMFIRVFDAEPWSLRVVSAVFGILTVMGIFFLTQELFKKKDGEEGPFGLKRSERIAFLAALFAATELWAVLFARVGFRANMAPCFLAWSLFFLIKSLPLIKEQFAKSLSLALAGGLVFGLGMHSYIAYRATPIIIAIIFFIKIASAVKEKYAAKFISTFLVFTIASAVVFAPLAFYFMKNPSDFLGRTSQVSVFSSASPITALAVNTIKTLGMWNIAGDFNWRHNYSGDPMLSPIVGVFFLVGIGLCVALIAISIRKKSPDNDSFPAIVLLSSLGVALLPVVISSEGIPHALRAILAIPPVFILSGLGADWAIAKLQNHTKPRSVKIIIAILMIAVAIEGYFLYFVRWANNPNIQGAYSADYVSIAREINALPKEKTKYVLVKAGGADVRGWPMPTQTVMFLTNTFLPENRPAKNITYIHDISEIPPAVSDYAVFTIK